MLLKPAEDAAASRWLTERLTSFATGVLGVVPSGFEAYARVFHPASRVTLATSSPLRWVEVAALTGRTAHRAMQWPGLRGNLPPLRDYTALTADDVWVEGPDEGSLPPSVAAALWPLLEVHTQTRDRCFFAVWEGFGYLPRTVLEAPGFELPAREFRLFTGPLAAIEQTFCAGDIENTLSGGVMVAITTDSDTTDSEDPVDSESTRLLGEAASAMSRDIFVPADSDELFWEELGEALEQLRSLPPPYQSANLWWPEDRSWCVATEIDFNATYVAGTQVLVDALLACEELESWQVGRADRRRRLRRRHPQPYVRQSI